MPIGERMAKVIEVYKEKCDDEWHDKLMETGSLIHILRSHDDSFTIPEDEDGSQEAVQTQV